MTGAPVIWKDNNPNSSSSSYNLDGKRKIYREYFTKDNMILKPIDKKNRYNSVVDDSIIKNRRLIFEVLELDGPNLIRFAMGRDGNCTCRSELGDKEDMINLRNLLLKVYPLEG